MLFLLCEPYDGVCTDVCENCLGMADFYCSECQNTYCKMCSAVRHRQKARSHHCLTRLSKLPVPVKTNPTSSTSSKYILCECSGVVLLLIS
jgi:hypothetical protein